MTTTPRLGRRSALPDAGEDYQLVDFSVASDGGGLFLFVRETDAAGVYCRDTDHSGVSFARTKSGVEAGFRLFHAAGEEITGFDLPRLDVSFARFDLFPDGRVPAAGARCAWRGVHSGMRT